MILCLVLYKSFEEPSVEEVLGNTPEENFA